MRKAAHEVQKAALFRALDREALTAKMALARFGIGHATFYRWRAAWKKRKTQADGLKTPRDALMEAP